LAAKQVKQIADSTNDPSSRLIDWVEYILTRARVIRIQVPDSANAFRIFETLNDRGLKLALSDLLKNYLFQQSGDRIAEGQKNWVAMASVIEAAEDEGLIVDFIRHLWCSQYGLTREKELYDRIKEKITSKQKAIDFSNTIANSARTYAAIVNTDNELWASYGSEARSYVAILNLLGMTQIRPLILSILQQFSATEVKKSLRLFVSWAVRFVVVGGVGGGTLESHYSARASSVTDGTIKTAAALLKEMRAIVPGDADFAVAFSSATVSRHPHGRYYLRVLERQQAGEEEPEFVPNTSEEQITLEHVLPQNPDKDWKHFDQETMNRFYKRIGNLALMKKGKNDDVGNKKFSEKAKLYSKSSFKLTAGLKDYAEKGQWTASSIDARQKMLAQLAVQSLRVSMALGTTSTQAATLPRKLLHILKSRLGRNLPISTLETSGRSAAEGVEVPDVDRRELQHQFYSVPCAPGEADPAELPPHHCCSQVVCPSSWKFVPWAAAVRVWQHFR
jgi:hypothetical protein